jgi:hypothetical protein
MDIYLWRRFGLSYEKNACAYGKKVADIFIQFMEYRNILDKIKT